MSTEANQRPVSPMVIGKRLLRRTKMVAWQYGVFGPHDAVECLECGGMWLAPERQAHRRNCTVVQMRAGAR